MRRKKAQSILEFVILMIIIIGALLAMQNYIKRGLQGRWKVAVDDLGEQYDPASTNSSVVERVVSNSDTQIRVVKDVGGFMTNRIDSTRSKETRTGTVVVGSQ